MAGTRHDAGSDASPRPPCENGVKDGAEDGVDCGFSCNTACVSGHACVSDAGCGAGATPLTGVHRQGLVLTKASSPYVLTADTQVAGTLVVEPGVVVLGDTHVLRAESVRAVGTCGARITFVDTTIDAGTSSPPSGAVVLRFVDLLGGSVLSPTGDSRYSSVYIADSRLRGVRYLYLPYPAGTTVIERNVFLGGEGIFLALDDGTTARITSNYFEDVKLPTDYKEAAITLQTNLGVSGVAAKYNTFAGTNGVVVSVGRDVTNFDAKNNYWGTTDPAVIEQRIYDAADDIELTASIPYVPFLTAPHPSAPGRDGYSTCVDVPDSGLPDSGGATTDGGSPDARVPQESGSGSDSGPSIAGACDQISQASVCTETITPPTGVTLATVQSVCLNGNGGWIGSCPSSGRVTRCEANKPALGHVIYSYYSVGGTPVTAQAMDSYCTLQGWKLLTP